MITYLSNKTVSKLIQSGSIQEDEKDIYAYGLQQGLFIILNIVTSIFIGILADMLWQCVLFMGIYLPLRSFAGGYHARSPWLCYLYSAILITTVLLPIKFVAWTNFMCLGITLFAGAVIFILSPVEDMNKPLDSVEVIRYRKRTRTILIFQIIIFFLFLILKVNGILPVISISLLALSIMLILGKIKNNIIV